MQLNKLLSLAWAIGASATTSGETPYIHSYFYVGGEYVDNGAGGHIFHNQMYVEKLTPVNGSSQSLPLVLIHGQAQTGTVIIFHSFLMRNSVC